MSSLVEVRLVGEGWSKSDHGASAGDTVRTAETGDATEWWAAPGIAAGTFPYIIRKDTAHPFGGELVEALGRLDGDQVVSPGHYQALKEATGMQVWDLLDILFSDNPDLWNAGKYLMRAGRKDGEDQDLAKLEQYVARRRAKLKSA